MGRRTLQSLPGGRGLPGRRNLVLSRQGDLAPEGAEVFHEVQPMLDAAGEDAFVIGGAQVYRLLLPACRRLYVTQIDADGGADVFFPEPAPELWRITEQSPWQMCIRDRRWAAAAAWPPCGAPWRRASPCPTP